MDRSRLLENDPDAEVIRRDFEIQIKTVGLGEFELVRKGPLHYEGPNWISAMWFAFLLSRRTVFLWRDPGFEGDFVKGDTLAQSGIRVGEQSGSCASSDVRVPAGWVVEMCDVLRSAAALEDEDVALLDKARAVLERPGLRDVKEAKKA